MRRIRILSAILILFSICSLTAYAASGDTTVYVTNTGNKYHNWGCHYLKSVNSITLEAAVDQGYTPCSYCDPPALDETYPETENQIITDTQLDPSKKKNTSQKMGDFIENEPETTIEAEPESNSSDESKESSNFFKYLSLVLGCTTIYYFVRFKISEKEQEKINQEFKEVYGKDAGNFIKTAKSDIQGEKI